MKKVTLFLLVFCMLVSPFAFASCAPSTAELISRAVEKTNQLDSYEADMEIDMDIKVQGTTVSVPISISMTAEGLQGDEPKVDGDVDMTVMGQKIKMDVYSDGEWSYVSANGQKYKQKIDEKNKSYSDTASSMLKDIPEDILKDVEAVKNDDGSVTVEFEMDSETFEEIFEDAIENAESSSGGAAAGAVKIDNAEVEITVKDGYIKKYALSFDMEMKVSGQNAEASVEMVLEFEDYNGKYDIEPPKGYKDYKEFSEK